MLKKSYAGGMYPLDKVGINAWLEAHGRDRAWLAKHTRSEIGTVNSWFSTRGFSDAALAAIEALMRLDEKPKTEPDETALIQFTSGEFEKIDAARRALGYASRPPFYHDAVMDFVQRMTQQNLPAAQRHDLALVAEERVTYRPTTAVNDKFVDAAREYVVQNPLPTPPPLPPPESGAETQNAAGADAAARSAGAPRATGKPAAKRAGK